MVGSGFKYIDGKSMWYRVLVPGSHKKVKNQKPAMGVLFEETKAMVAPL